MLKFICRSLAVVSLALSLNTGIHAQTSAVTSGPAASIEAGTAGTIAAPTAAGLNALLLNQAQQSATATAAKAAADAPATDAAPARSLQRVSGPNQFQRFVQESTGRLLPVYGRDLFDAPQNYSANTAVPAPDNYILGPGDQIQLQVSGPQDFSTTLVLDRDRKSVV